MFPTCRINDFLVENMLLSFVFLYNQICDLMMKHRNLKQIKLTWFKQHFNPLNCQMSEHVSKGVGLTYFSDDHYCSNCISMISNVLLDVMI